MASPEKSKKKSVITSFIRRFYAHSQNRTDDLIITSDALYH